MSHARYIIGDTRDVVATMPDNSVDLVVTSPPFLALRSYLPDDHPDKHREIGSEPGPAEFIDTLLELTAEWGRVVTETGTIAVELGDTYAGTGSSSAGIGRTGRTGHDRDGDGFSGRSSHGAGGGEGWPLAKSLCLIPEMYRVALVYGINPLTGKPSPAGRWRARNVIRWVRPNPPVGALGDKFRPATSDMVIICRATDRWFDLDAVRTEHSVPPEKMTGTEKKNRAAAAGRGEDRFGDDTTTRVMAGNPAGAPPLDWWKISPGGYSGAHYAVFPPELVTKPIEAMCPRQVCRTCGQPRRRITSEPTGDGGDGLADDGHRDTTGQGHHGHRTRTVDTLGWTDCGHDDYRPGIVLDPFAGSGTTLAVATGHGRDAIGIDIDERNADLAVERCGMFLTVETHTNKAAA